MSAIDDLARFLMHRSWSHDRLAVAIRAVCTEKKRPGNPELAIAVYEKSKMPAKKKRKPKRRRAR